MNRPVALCSTLLGLPALVASASAQTVPKLDPILRPRANHLNGHSRVIVRPLNATVDLLSGSLLSQYREHGFKAAVTKPFTVQELNAALDELAGTWSRATLSESLKQTSDPPDVA